VSVQQAVADDPAPYASLVKHVRPESGASDATTSRGDLNQGDTPKTGTRGLISALALATCFAQSLDAEQTSQGKSSGTTPPAVIAEVNGESITAAEIEKAVGQQIARLEEQIYTLRKQRLDNLIADRLLAAEAAKRKIAVSALLDAEVNAKVTVVTEAEIDGFIEANKARLKGEGAELREAVRAQLQRQKAAVQRQAFVDSLRAAGSIVVHLPPPPVYRVEVSATAAASSKGPADAAVTIMEFTDFHCPYCKGVQATIAMVLERYADKVRLVHHDLPIDALHPQARKVHEAARCAGEQNKFWEYRERAFPEGPKTPRERTKIASDLGLNMPAFNTCVAGQAVAVAVREDETQARSLNLTSTPTFYINGRQLIGAAPLESFVKIIEDELSRLGKATVSR
jgi:protein-disulfide isomerase